MRVLVTRPREDAAATAARLREMGHAPLIAPLLDIRFRDGPELSLDGVQAIVATSANGVRALIGHTARRDLPLFAVGPQTAAAARDAGFANVKNSAGDSLALADAIAGWAAPQSGTLLHVAGNEAGGKLASRLQAHGFKLRREILYDVATVERLPDDAANALCNGELDAVLLYSPLSAQSFVRGVIAAGLEDASGKLLAVCISRAAGEKAEALPFREIRIAARPGEKEMLDQLPR